MSTEFAAGAVLDETDGYKLVWSDRWVHLRASGTEPVSQLPKHRLLQKLMLFVSVVQNRLVLIYWAKSHVCMRTP